MLKRVSVLLLALVLASTALPALADANYQVLSSFTARDVNLNRLANTYSMRSEDSNYYQLLDANGNVLVPESAGYVSMYPNNSSYGYYKVEISAQDRLHDEGLLDGKGRVLVPAQYADVNLISDRWQAGVKLTPSSADDKDYTVTNYSDNTKSFYRIESADFYFDGQLVGTLNRSEYGNGSCSAYGAYLVVTNLARERVFYNSKMEKSPRPAEYSGEFESYYKNGKTYYFHQGSGQQAFVAGCTLDIADLENPYLYDRGVLYDVHGDVVFKAAQNYDSIRRFYGGYAVAAMNRLNGLVDLTGREVIPLEYDSITNYEDKPFEFGCVSAVKNGKFGFLDQQGNVTSPFVYSNDAVRNRTSFATIQNLDGTIIVLSGLVGELPEHFADVSFPSSYGCASFVGINANKEKCVVDIYGNTLLPYTEDFNSLDLTRDGSLALGYLGNRQYVLLHFDISAAAQPSAAPAPVAQPTAAPAPAPQQPAAPSADGTWTCENGHPGNTGKFCTECGFPRPVEEAPLTHCPNCNYEFPNGLVPKFCPECGTPVKK